MGEESEDCFAMFPKFSSGFPRTEQKKEKIQMFAASVGQTFLAVHDPWERLEWDDLMVEGSRFLTRE